MYIAWCWTIDPTQRFICGSYAQTIARKDAAFTQMIINSDKYQRYFPSIKLTKDAVDLIRNTNNGERYATSSGSGITGIHAHQIIIDDPLNPKESSSEVERRTANDWFDTTLPTRKVDKKITPTIIVMQRLHEDDPTGHILSKGLPVKHICLPAELSDNVTPDEVRDNYTNGLLDTIRLDKQVLDEMRKTLGSYGYSGQFEQRPAPQEGGLIKRDFFQIIDKDKVPKGTVDFVADTAYTSNEANDPSGFMAYVKNDGCLYITGYLNIRAEFPELVKSLPMFCKLNGYDHTSIIRAEPKASGKSLIQTLKQTGLNIKEAENPTKDKEARVKNILSFLECGKVYMVRGGWNQAFIDTCANFPNDKHDEEVDCLVMACRQAFIKKGLRFIG